MSPHPDNPFCGEDRRTHNSLRTEGPLQRIDLLTTCPRHVGSGYGILLGSGPDAFDALGDSGSQLNGEPMEFFALRRNQLLRQTTNAIF